MRILNSKVLEKAPCSVKILIDHGNFRRQSKDTSANELPSYDVAIALMTGKPELWAKGWHKTLEFVSPWYILQNAKDDGFED